MTYMNTTTLSLTCPFCRQAEPLVVSTDGLAAWRAGECIQDVMPEISADDRERLISGTCPDCWAEMFGVDDEEENEEE